jgi:hypothetical protein
MTIVWHVDDLKISHMSEKSLNDELEWLESVFGPLVETKGECHTYLGMDLCFTNRRLQVLTCQFKAPDQDYIENLSE